MGRRRWRSWRRGPGPPELPSALATAARSLIDEGCAPRAPPQQRPWPLLPRSTRPVLEGREPHRNPVESSAAKELVDGGFVEPTSNRTFVVSRSGYTFYEQEIKPHSE